MYPGSRPMPHLTRAGPPGERQADCAHPSAAAGGALRPAGRGLPEPRRGVQPAPGHHEGATANNGRHLQRRRRGKGLYTHGITSF
eukprot:6137723-Pyramimonas_sp.AAC.1